MAKIEDLINQIPDEKLRKAIGAEVKALKKTKKFGLVFEEHLPETVRLPRVPVREGDLVALKREAGNRLWRVKAIEKGAAVCDPAIEGYPVAQDKDTKFPLADLVVVRNFGDPIYPALVPVDRVARGGPDKPWHTLSRADTWAKAKGLAAFADNHGMDFGRLIIGRRQGGKLQIIDVNEKATRETEYGARYSVDCRMETPEAYKPCIRTVWQFEDNCPRLLTAHPLE